ncbi:MAG: hypothetical protein Kow0063_02660 [Anaerolineae bacterium]
MLAALVASRLLERGGGEVRFRQRWLRSFLAGTRQTPRPAASGTGSWGEKLVLGLTGNIAVGKSTVLDMLEVLGAQTIDADSLVHRLREPGAPGYQAIVDWMGKAVLQPDGRIDARKLADRAFRDPEVLARLEQLFRPLVVAQIEQIVGASGRRVIVIEAIKLLEGSLKDRVDMIWVVDASREQQIRRLVTSRGLSPEQAVARVEAQGPQAEKLAQADVIIRNEGDLAGTWQQVLDAWPEVLRRLFDAGWLDEGLVETYIAVSLEKAQVTLPVVSVQQRLARLAIAAGLADAIPVSEAIAILDAVDDVLP